MRRIVGTPAVVQTSTRGEATPLPAGLEVLVSTGDQPRHLTVEVRRGEAVDAQPALEDAANLLRSVVPLVGVVAHLQRTPPSKSALPSPEPRPSVEAEAPRATIHPAWWRWALPSVALAGGAALLLWPRTIQDTTPPPSPVEAVVQVQATADDVELADILQFSSSKEPMTVQRRVVVPDAPLKGQDTPPCTSPSRPVNGGCWLKLDDKPPCPRNSAEHAGACWVPVRGEKAMPMSFDRRRP
ncbi:hypothetical protein JY651_28555 [Pyxidicoccus parkwayensis]|uniref:Uncharacterized protein n=1 Tax=Pyxidicoccus parkwayensis TaxID=2813578 RepID=A0ABX7NLP9_9BACT|nr:hypothetical protein [Pyxidicoccus parkwaysis]QSQ19284.1 hypothetical protein JY651_28555 [Pyxidicoccus parkwaysis]